MATSLAHANSAFSYHDSGHKCTSMATQDQRLPYVSPIPNGAEGWVRGEVLTTTIPGDTTVYGDGVPVWWQASDEAVLSAAAIAASTTSIPQTQTRPSAQPATSSLSSASTAPASAHKSGLSTGAKTGIGVGIAAGAVCVLVAALLFLRRKNRAKRLPELRGPAPVEKPDDKKPQELPAYTQPVELPI
ncbi:hypothetical protein K491DRAFT_696953 [Lophiostoma macrostomum CBS 122681]|uniref:Mid2 domain-containing protein n=1 Tax=Lophiostoma macrostomum CBS 122681 TaxID=1314788 RepID=A0A6A6SV51_9PLEO|nr:hypothetical protein K491DRAFT_696953 [Lophiostoma macrostomum CBS 122681]